MHEYLHFFGLGDEKSAFLLVPLMGVLNPSRSTRAESRLSLRRASTLVFGISRGPPVWWDPCTTGLLTEGVMYIRLVGVADPVEGVMGVEKYSWSFPLFNVWYMAAVDFRATAVGVTLIRKIRHFKNQKIKKIHLSPFQSNIFQKVVKNIPRKFNNKKLLWNQNFVVLGEVLNNFGRSELWWHNIVKKIMYSLDAHMALCSKSNKISWAVSNLDDLGVVHAVAPPIPA